MYRSLLPLLLLIFALGCQGTRQSQTAATTPATPPAVVQQDIPFDPQTRRGVLPNGLTYYIRQNARPENYAELRLAVNTGSLNEADDQQGLAHFVEHMCFNGSANFPKNALVDYLEAIGTRFGPHLNAYTSFDETVYMLRVPTNDPAKFGTGLQILEDWAHGVSFDGEEIDKERGVVVEEWRTRLGADNRMQPVYLPKLYYQARYAERLPIGQVEVLRTFEHDALRRYYRDWYRPELMALVAVGDFDPDSVEQMIRARFGSIPASAEPRRPSVYPVPDHAETLVAIASDEEANLNRVSVIYKHDKQPLVTLGDYRASIVRRLASSLLDARLEELLQSETPPFTAAFSGYGSLGRNKDQYSTTAYVPANGFETGMAALLRECTRAGRFGFTATELERAKRTLITNLETQYRESDKVESSRLVMSYVYHYLSGTPVPGIGNSLDLHRTLLPGISLEEVNVAFAAFLREDNRVVILTGARKEGQSMPDEATVRRLLADAAQETLTPYVDQVADAPLMEVLPTPGTVAKTRQFDELGVTEVVFGNGARAILKPTTFKNDEILMQAYSPGGTSRYPDSLYMSADQAAAVIALSGVGSYDNVRLEKYLSDKVLRLSPYIEELEEGMEGNCSPQDVETFLQLVHLYFTQPRKDAQAFGSYMSKTQAVLTNVLSNPQYWFRNELSKVLYQGHFRRDAVPSPEKMAQTDLDDLYAIYQDRFADAGDFTFVFVGNFEVASFVPLLATYIGSLPGLGRGETWQDVGVTYAETPLSRTLYRGKEPQSQVFLRYRGDFDWSADNRLHFDATTQVLGIMMRETMREDKGGVYGVGVNGNTVRDPKPEYALTVSFTCAPENVDDLVATATEQVRILRSEGPSEKNLAKVQELMRKDYEVNVQENSFWLRQLEYAYRYDLDPHRVLGTLARIDALQAADLQATAQRYFGDDRLIRVALRPESDR
ncbi:MAG: insulinase family protein [Bacteroidia bacterium]